MKAQMSKPKVQNLNLKVKIENKLRFATRVDIISLFGRLAQWYPPVKAIALTIAGRERVVDSLGMLSMSAELLAVDGVINLSILWMKR